MSSFAAWRRRWRRPKRGVARGVAVYGSLGYDDPEKLQELLAKHNQVPQWAAERNLLMNKDPESLLVIDGALNEWKVDPLIGHKLTNEVGLYLGNMMVKNIDGAHWTVWPNGHPVVVLNSGKEMDVTDLVRRRLQVSGRSLSDIYSQALNE